MTIDWAEEAGVCEVAGDLVQLGREDEARELLRQAPNRLASECPACFAAKGHGCAALDVTMSLHDGNSYELSYQGYMRATASLATSARDAVFFVFAPSDAGVTALRYGLWQGQSLSFALMLSPMIQLPAGVAPVVGLLPRDLPKRIVPHLERVRR